ncbi:MAG TPA: type II toxin-antitoxin system Phd/YefM family antitoxin, partial [Pyrinomonadaceae bacterium]|nr:type II toxin-antitoxin system Phd/YefM family antitoxin [Pyrinomonadaceae bacterium]
LANAFGVFQTDPPPNCRPDRLLLRRYVNLVRLVSEVNCAFMQRSKKSNRATSKRSDEPWQLQTAKAQFSELFRRARTEGPQVVTRQGKEQVVVLPAEQYARLTKRVRQPKSLVKFFAESPLKDVKLDLSRDKDSGREIKL